ncbi:MAG: hypothetical protein JETT_2193 [Candidatus Jettenia ecosi]|uniref:Uncharacterized protein n=1 Tax=Candidatus Jettenia ecosi TaxID=2494326 RepID=A0A533QLT6_9BACT|nr:MAG: hypothetical protein JETT_2193 [Candidatus Jettenia ecosi]
MKNNIIPRNPPLKKGEIVNALEKGEIPRSSFFYTYPSSPLF